MKYHNEQFYIAKTLLMSAIFTIFASVVGFWAYQNIDLHTQLPEEFILYSTAFVLAYSVIYAIIVGFTILIAVTRYQNLSLIINQEIGCLGDILDFTQYISGQDALKEQIIDDVKNYGISVSNDEWLAMEDGNHHQTTTSYLRKLMDSINNIDLNNSKKAIVFESFINRLKDLTTFRANRLKEAKETFPKLLMLTLYIISAIFLLGIFLTFTPDIFFQTLFLSTTAFTVSLVIQMVGDIGNPYKPGAWLVSKKDYETIKTSVLTQI